MENIFDRLGNWFKPNTEKEIKVKPNMELEANKTAQKMVLDRYKKEFA